ncbi:hypothetical protein GCM10010404_06350 [Nonomuraea africana]
MTWGPAPGAADADSRRVGGRHTGGGQRGVCGHGLTIGGWTDGLGVAEDAGEGPPGDAVTLEGWLAAREESVNTRSSYHRAPLSGPLNGPFSQVGGQNLTTA